MRVIQSVARRVHIVCCTYFLITTFSRQQFFFSIIHSSFFTSVPPLSLSYPPFLPSSHPSLSLSFSALLAPGETRLIHTVALDEPLLLTINLKYARTQASNVSFSFIMYSFFNLLFTSFVLFIFLLVSEIITVSSLPYFEILHCSSLPCYPIPSYPILFTFLDLLNSFFLHHFFSIGWNLVPQTSCQGTGTIIRWENSKNSRRIPRRK
jgi:hypothetical protein